MDKKITDLTELTTADDGDYIPIVDVSDTTDDDAGTSKKIQKVNLRLSSFGLNVKDYGATGDGSTDDTEALQDAIDAAAAANTTLFIPEGTYNFTQLTLNDSGITIQGAGVYGTILKHICTVSDTPVVALDIANTANVQYCNFRDFLLRGDANSLGGFDLAMSPDYYMATIKFSNVRADGFIKTGAYGFGLGYLININFDKCFARGNYYGIYRGDTATYGTMTTVKFSEGEVNLNTAHGLCLHSSSNQFIFENTNFENNVGAAIFADNGGKWTLKLSNCWFEDNDDDGTIGGHILAGSAGTANQPSRLIIEHCYQSGDQTTFIKADELIAYISHCLTLYGNDDVLVGTANSIFVLTHNNGYLSTNTPTIQALKTALEATSATVLLTEYSYDDGGVIQDYTVS